MNETMHSICVCRITNVLRLLLKKLNTKMQSGYIGKNVHTIINRRYNETAKQE